ncbi:MAG TPA: ATP phosphoribosyltransferase regulatory subunit, partial [Azospirillum sp.]
SFTLFSRGVRGELGGGGRYRAGSRPEAETEGEPATGFTLYMDTVLRAVPAPAGPRRVFLPHGTPGAEADRLRAEGWVTVAGLEPVADTVAEAKRLHCGHHYAGGAVAVVG